MCSFPPIKVLIHPRNVLIPPIKVELSIQLVSNSKLLIYHNERYGLVHEGYSEHALNLQQIGLTFPKQGELYLLNLSLFQ